MLKKKRLSTTDHDYVRRIYGQVCTLFCFENIDCIRNLFLLNAPLSTYQGKLSPELCIYLKRSTIYLWLTQSCGAPIYYNLQVVLYFSKHWQVVLLGRFVGLGCTASAQGSNAMALPQLAQNYLVEIKLCAAFTSSNHYCFNIKYFFRFLLLGQLNRRQLHGLLGEQDNALMHFSLWIGNLIFV